MPGRGVPIVKGRVEFLDGLRGVAIALVVLFHTYSRWTKLIPFGREFASFPLFAEGWLGVELFFMISGFVIFMTLGKCQSFAEFIGRRWLRLFPAMLVCSLLIFATAWFFWDRPLGKPGWNDLLPGLTFIQPEWWSWVLGAPQRSLENSFWTLFVEVKFYAISGAVYFLLGETAALAVVALLFLAALVGQYLGLSWLNGAADFLDASYFGWFAAGALFYRWSRAHSPGRFGLAVAVALLAPVAIEDPRLEFKIFAYGIVLLFVTANLSPAIQRLLSWRPLLFLGFVSYPLYLVHENMTVSLMIKMGRWAPWIPAILNPMLPLAAVLGIAWIVAAFAEPWLRNELRRSQRMIFQWGLPGRPAATSATHPTDNR